MATGVFDVDAMIKAVAEQTDLVKKEIDNLTTKKGGEKQEVDIGQMMKLQFKMHSLTQVSETVTNVLSACNQCQQSIARGVKS